MPPTNFPNSPINTGPQGLPGGGTPLPVYQTPAFQQQNAQFGLQNQLSSQYGLGDIFSLGGDVWGWIKDHAGDLVPKDARNPDGSIDWTKFGADAIKGLGNFLSSHKKDIIDGLSAYSQYQRQNKADALGKEAVDMAKQSYAEKAPLRVAGQSGMLNPQANTPDLSSLKAGIPQPTIAPLPVAGQNQNMRNAQGVAGPGSGNPFAKPLPIAPITPTGGASGPPMPGMPGMPGGGASPAGPSPMRPIAPAAPRPLPVAGTPQNPQQPAHYLINGLDQDASGKPVAGGYNELSDLYKQLGTSPGSVNPRILAAVKANPKLIDALPVADAETLRRTMQSVGA